MIVTIQKRGDEQYLTAAKTRFSNAAFCSLHSMQEPNVTHLYKGAEGVGKPQGVKIIWADRHGGVVALDLSNEEADRLATAIEQMRQDADS